VISTRAPPLSAALAGQRTQAKRWVKLCTPSVQPSGQPLILSMPTACQPVAMTLQ
jgi:hypothetical protein